MSSFFVTIPHSGEKIPPEVKWLAGLPEPILMCDVDRFVDQIYAPTLAKLRIPFVKAEWHRYVVDLNRLPDDVDEDSVQGHPNKAGKFSRGLLWSITTLNYRLMPNPISTELHKTLVAKYYQPFHDEVLAMYKNFESHSKVIYHLDAHSMPSVGTKEHRDPGERRADIVVSDCLGKSCRSDYKDLVIKAYAEAGFKVAYNWPYVGGRITEIYGQPQIGHHAIQVEMNRALYMNEETKKILPEKLTRVQVQVEQALQQITSRLIELK